MQRQESADEEFVRFALPQMASTGAQETNENASVPEEDDAHHANNSPDRGNGAAEPRATDTTNSTDEDHAYMVRISLPMIADGSAIREEASTSSSIETREVSSSGKNGGLSKKQQRAAESEDGEDRSTAEPTDPRVSSFLAAINHIGSFSNGGGNPAKEFGSATAASTSSDTSSQHRQHNDALPEVSPSPFCSNSQDENNKQTVKAMGEQPTKEGHTALNATASAPMTGCQEGEHQPLVSAYPVPSASSSPFQPQWESPHRLSMQNLTEESTPPTAGGAPPLPHGASPPSSQPREQRINSLPSCRYGAGCIRRNPSHFKEYVHPDDHPYADRYTQDAQHPQLRKNLEAALSMSNVDEASTATQKQTAEEQIRALFAVARNGKPGAAPPLGTTPGIPPREKQDACRNSSITVSPPSNPSLSSKDNSWVVIDDRKETLHRVHAERGATSHTNKHTDAHNIADSQGDDTGYPVLVPCLLSECNALVPQSELERHLQTHFSMSETQPTTRAAPVADTTPVTDRGDRSNTSVTQDFDPRALERLPAVDAMINAMCDVRPLPPTDSPPPLYTHSTGSSDYVVGSTAAAAPPISQPPPPSIPPPPLQSTPSGTETVRADSFANRGSRQLWGSQSLRAPSGWVAGDPSVSGTMSAGVAGHMGATDSLVPCLLEHCGAQVPRSLLKFHMQTHLDEFDEEAALMIAAQQIQEDERSNGSFKSRQSTAFMEERQHSLTQQNSAFTTNGDEEECTCCFGRYQASEMYRLGCSQGHRMCRDLCVQRLLDIAVEENTLIACPMCKETLHAHEVVRLLPPGHPFAENYDAMELRALFQSNERTFMKCPNENKASGWVCGKVFEVPASLQARPTRVTCLNQMCQLDFCSMCRESPYHYNLTCEEAVMAKAVWEYFLKEWKSFEEDDSTDEEGSRQKRLREQAEALQRYHELCSDEEMKSRDCVYCPNCLRVVAKMAGCNAMVCGENAHGGNVQNGCGHKFDWAQARNTHPYKAQIPPEPADSSRVAALLASIGVFLPSNVNDSATDSPRSTTADTGANGWGTRPNGDAKTKSRLYEWPSHTCAECDGKIAGVRFECINCPSEISFCVKCLHSAKLQSLWKKQEAEEKAAAERRWQQRERLMNHAANMAYGDDVFAAMYPDRPTDTVQPPSSPALPTSPQSHHSHGAGRHGSGGAETHGPTAAGSAIHSTTEEVAEQHNDPPPFYRTHRGGNHFFRIIEPPRDTAHYTLKAKSRLTREALMYHAPVIRRCVQM